MNLKDAGIYDLINIFTGQPSDTHKSSLGVGIINNKERFINIPAYQRPYRWEDKHIDQLFSDYFEDGNDSNHSEYFIGSAVAVQKIKDGKETEFDLVDGQQRITTLYLLSYISFLLEREWVFAELKSGNPFKLSEYFRNLKTSYVNIIGRNSKPFDNILNTLNDTTLSSEELLISIKNCYINQLCIAEDKSTVEETLKHRYEQNKAFFEDEQLCLKYSRKQYDKVLKNALCSVYLKSIENTNRYELDIITLANKPEEEFLNNYTKAMCTIFNNLWNRAIQKCGVNANKIDICKQAFEMSKKIIENMSICIVLTGDEGDAYKLFEVLNDRALEVEDLELIKNHFYKEYCTKSNDSEERQDRNIAELEAIWADKIFSNNSVTKTKLISYLAAVYFTCDKNLDNKNGTRYKNTIAQKYSCEFNKETNPYTYNHILADFNAYFAIKIILDKMGIRAQKLYQCSLCCEQENKSITYKTFHLLNALDYSGVMAAITNVIISSYMKQNGIDAMNSDNFEKSFTEYIDNLISDASNNNAVYSRIHQCSYLLRIAALKGKDYAYAREIARKIIETNGCGKYSSVDLDFTQTEVAALNAELSDWLDAWNYDGSDKKNFILKVMFLSLLTASRKIEKDKVTLTMSDLTYKLDADKLQLDHLEAKNYDRNAPEKYYSTNDLDKRAKDVNSYLGNFMILDATDNNLMKNVPLTQALDFYVGIEKSWLITDIKEMVSDEKYVFQTTKVPKEAFFIERSKQLKKYFKALLNRQLNQKTITVEL